MTVLENIQLLKNKFILSKMLAVKNNKKVVLLDEGERNENSTQSNATYQLKLLHHIFDKTPELTNKIDQPANLPKTSV